MRGTTLFEDMSPSRREQTTLTKSGLSVFRNMRRIKATWI